MRGGVHSMLVIVRADVSRFLSFALPELRGKKQRLWRAIFVVARIY